MHAHDESARWLWDRLRDLRATGRTPIRPAGRNFCAWTGVHACPLALALGEAGSVSFGDPVVNDMSDHKTPKDLGRELKGLADQIRVRLHLAGMEAKDVWSKLEPKVHEFERKAEETGAEAVSELTKMGTELKDQLAKLKDRLKS